MEGCTVLGKSEILRAVNLTEINYLIDFEIAF